MKGDSARVKRAVDALETPDLVKGVSQAISGISPAQMEIKGSARARKNDQVFFRLLYQTMKKFHGKAKSVTGSNRLAISRSTAGTAVILASLLVGSGSFYLGQAFAHSSPAMVTWSATGSFTPISSTCVGGTGPSCTGGYTVTQVTATYAVTGDLSGTLQACSGTLVTDSNGAYEFRVNCTFAGTVSGTKGSGTMSWNYWGDGSGGTLQGGNTWTNGRDGLRGVQGSGTYEGYFTGATTGVATGLDQVSFG